MWTSANSRGEEDPRNIEAGAAVNPSHDPIIKGGSMATNKRTHKGSSECISQIKHFKIQSKEDQFQGNFPDKMTEYVNSHF